jgi:hypothetical protein
LDAEAASARAEELDRVAAVRRWADAVCCGEIDPEPAECEEVQRFILAAQRWRERAA